MHSITTIQHVLSFLLQMTPSHISIARLRWPLPQELRFMMDYECLLPKNETKITYCLAADGMVRPKNLPQH